MTLIELMISMVIGLVVVGALIGLYTGTIGSNTTARAQAELNEDGQYALKILTSQLRLAGYNPLPAGLLVRNELPGNFAILGCDNGFSNVATAKDPSELTCASSASSGGHAIAITYEADVFNTIPVGSSPTSCIGESLNKRSAIHSAADNRFYVQNNTLYCTGVTNGTSPPSVGTQPLVDNVVRIEFSYGTANAAAGSNTVTGYLSATQLGNATGPAGSDVPVSLQPLLNVDRWAKVMTVRVCVLMRSAQPVFDENTVYYDCSGTEQAGDKYLRRAYTSTVALRNRIALQ